VDDTASIRLKARNSENTPATREDERQRLVVPNPRVIEP
jgi:hypothetical protein